MSITSQVKMKPVPWDATVEERQAAYEEYRTRLLAANPHLRPGRNVFATLWALFRRKL